MGFGYTDRPAGAVYRMPYWRDHAVAVLDALGIESCFIVGNSFGGGLALALAAAHPERVDRLVLMGSAGYRFEITPGLDAAGATSPRRSGCGS